MIVQGFHIGDNDWWIMCYYDVCTTRNLLEVDEVLHASGVDKETRRKAVENLAKVNTGFTFTSFSSKSTAIFLSRASSPEQMYDSIQHELKHAVEHISEFYDVDSKSEEAAYLQGEIARQMFPAAAMVVCSCSPR